MPHKHKRDKLKSGSSSYNLPPSQVAYSLPVTKEKQPIKPSNRRRKKTSTDDTPRAFTRLLSTYRPPRSGLDDGTRPTKKRKTGAATSGAPASLPPTNPEPVSTAIPKIQHNEPFSAFAARVDAALPFSGLQKKTGTLKGIDKGRQTRTEKKMQRMYKEWREEDERMREKAQEDVSEDEEEGDDGLRAMGVGEEGAGKGKGKGKGGKRKRGGGAAGSSDEEDPWAAIAAKRKGSEGGGGLVGLHDVVQAPPRFTKAPKGKANAGLKVGQGGLKRQAELGEARRSVVEGYREMMRGKRAQGM